MVDAVRVTGEELGCPDCAAGEPHVCPFLYADQLAEPRRTTILAHLREVLDLTTVNQQVRLTTCLRPRSLSPSTLASDA